LHDSTCAERIQADRHKNDVADSKGGQNYNSIYSKKGKILSNIKFQCVLPAHPCFRKEQGMKYIIIAIIVLIGLLDYALIVACSHLEDREMYEYEEWLRRKDDENNCAD